MGRVDGKVALITGAARGQGRAHAVRLAEEGADIVALDIAGQIEGVPTALGTMEELEETGALVEKVGQEALVRRADVRDQAALDAVVADAIDRFGHIDIVAANAGIWLTGSALELTEDHWRQILDVDLVGVWRTVKAAAPSMIAAGRGGSVVVTSSAAGLKGYGWMAAYVSAKHGLVGLTRTLANELGPHGIRVNSVHPGSVATPMILGVGVAGITDDDGSSGTNENNNSPLGVRMLDPVDVSNAVLWLASDEARYITGVALPVDAGILL